MRYSTYAIGLLIIFLSFTAFAGLYVSLAPEYGQTIPSEFNNVYTNTTELSNFMDETTGLGLNMTEESKTASALEGEFDDLTTSQLKSVKLVWGSVNIVKNLFIEVAHLLKVPPIIVGVLFGALVFALLFAFISLIFRWKS